MSSCDSSPSAIDIEPECVSSPLASSQETDATEVSEPEGMLVEDIQALRGAEDSILQSVGLGAGTLGSHSARPEDIAGLSTLAGSCMPSAKGCSINDPPWTPLLHQFDPNVRPTSCTASRCRALGKSIVSCSTNTTTREESSPDGRVRETRYDHPRRALNRLPHERSSSPPSGVLPPVPIPRLPSASSTGSASSTDRHWCSEPGCNASCKRADDLRRHVRTVHADCAAGPFWVCKCGHWEYDGRKDKMTDHYESKHGYDKSQRPYTYKSVPSVGRQNHVPKMSNGTKSVRRHKFRTAGADDVWSGHSP